MDQNTTQIYARLQLDPVRASVDAAAVALMAAGAVKQKDEVPAAEAEDKSTVATKGLNGGRGAAKARKISSEFNK